ncbi:MAG: carboxymuconolactone decarboxylase family protein [Nevskia sp.]|nr:carboxymuconolactone decarboxylase family protein [Nevskia sp.]
MSELSSRERGLIGLGAALGSNCVQCAEHHIKLARAAGVDDDALRAAVSLADSIRQVPARKVLQAATEALAQPPSSEPVASCAVLDVTPAGGRSCC